MNPDGTTPIDILFAQTGASTTPPNTTPTEATPPPNTTPTEATSPSTTTTSESTETKTETEPATTEIKKEMTESESIGENQNPTVSLFNKELDLDTITVCFLIAFMWIIIWYVSGLWVSLKYDWVFLLIFALFIIYLFANVITAGTTSGGIVYELNILLTVEQMVAILLGSAILFVLFSKNLPAPEGCSSVIFKLQMSVVLILLISSLWVNVITTGRAFRFIRKFKQGIYNIALTFLIIVGIIYVKGVKCA